MFGNLFGKTNLPFEADTTIIKNIIFEDGCHSVVTVTEKMPKDKRIDFTL